MPKTHGCWAVTVVTAPIRSGGTEEDGPDPRGVVDDFVDLGDLEGNIGDRNDDISADVDLDRCSAVVIWCVRFGVAIGRPGLV